MNTVVLLMCLVPIIQCYYNGKQEYTRIKRAKYNFPSKFYKLPPMSSQISGPFSYTPPPGYTNDIGGPPANLRAYKVSRKPTDGLNDEDIFNMVKYLSKQDINKIIELAVDKDRFSEPNRPSFPDKNPYEFGRPSYEEQRPFYKDFSEGTDSTVPFNVKEEKVEYTNPNSYRDLPRLNGYQNSLLSNFDNLQEVKYNNLGNNNVDYSQGFVNYNGSPRDILDYSKKINGYVNQPNKFTYLSDLGKINNGVNDNFIYQNDINNHNNIPIENFINPQRISNIQNDLQLNNYNGNLQSNGDLASQDQLLFLDAYIQNEMNKQKFDNAVYTSGFMSEEESLPKPSNLREQDYEISYTNNVPQVASADSSSYKLENFANLPLMNYDDSKLDTVNSYNVPHYTVTHVKNRQQSDIMSPAIASASQKDGPVQPIIEPAPPRAAGQDQSDAHLKAIKIWTHKSKGTAYTLHEDGTLSLEKPIRPKVKPS